MAGPARTAIDRRRHAGPARTAPVLGAVATVLVAAGLLASCGSSDAGGAAGSRRGLHGTLTVSAAASLTEPFAAIDRDFERAHPGVRVRPTFDASSALAGQILEGAPVDVFAAADEVTMDEVVHGHQAAGTPVPFARNRMVIVTKPGNPAGIRALRDLTAAGVVALCGAEVPCGRLADGALRRARVHLPESSVTRGQNVKATLAAVSEGDAVAGIVYETDARAAGDAVATVAIPARANATTTYPVAVLTGAGNRSLARAFVAYLTSAPAQAVLRRHGFLPPR
jgi:molybdate transport system substrate-binding protein